MTPYKIDPDCSLTPRSIDDAAAPAGVAGRRERTGAHHLPHRLGEAEGVHFSSGICGHDEKLLAPLDGKSLAR